MEAVVEADRCFADFPSANNLTLATAVRKRVDNAASREVRRLVAQESTSTDLIVTSNVRPDFTCPHITPS